MRGEPFQTVECVEIAEKLRRQTLEVDNRFGRTRDARVVVAGVLNLQDRASVSKASPVRRVLATMRETSFS